MSTPAVNGKWLSGGTRELSDHPAVDAHPAVADAEPTNPGRQSDVDGDDGSIPARAADLLQITFGPHQDPFEAVLILSATGAPPTSVALHLTPAVLADLIDSLQQVHAAQRVQFGLPGADPELAAAEPGQGVNEENDTSAGQNRLHRAADPLGLRHLRQKTGTATVLAVIIAALTFIALLLQVLGK